jgi:hypothetical protein
MEISHIHQGQTLHLLSAPNDVFFVPDIHRVWYELETQAM